MIITKTAKSCFLQYLEQAYLAGYFVHTIEMLYPILVLLERANEFR